LADRSDSTSVSQTDQYKHETVSCRKKPPIQDRFFSNDKSPLVWALGKSRRTIFDILGAALLVLGLAFCVLGLSQFQSNTEDVLQWLPDNSLSRKLYNEFEAKFGSDDFLVVTWNDCTVDDPRLKHFCERLVDQDSGNLIQSVQGDLFRCR